MIELKKDLSGIKDVANELKNLLKDGGVMIIKGDLASGKTALVKEFVNLFDVKEDVTSPTFSLMNRYGENIYHYDLYNKGISNFFEIGLLEELEESGYHLIEWGDKKLCDSLKEIGFNAFFMEIEKEDNSRLYRIYNA